MFKVEANVCVVADVAEHTHHPLERNLCLMFGFDYKVEVKEIWLEMLMNRLSYYLRDTCVSCLI